MLGAASDSHGERCVQHSSSLPQRSLAPPHLVVEPGGDGRRVEHEHVDALVADLRSEARAKRRQERLGGGVEHREGRHDAGGRRGRVHEAPAQLLRCLQGQQGQPVI